MDLFLKFKDKDLYKFNYPYENINYSKKVLEEVKKYGLNQEKNNVPNLLEFSKPVNYSTVLEELYKNMPIYNKNLIEFPKSSEYSSKLSNHNNSSDTSDTSENLLLFPKKHNYTQELEGLYKKSSNNYMKELLEIYKNNPEYRAKLINQYMPRVQNKIINNTRKKNYEKNLEGLFPLKPKKTLLQKIFPFYKKTRKNRK
jgi:hypothetical protein